MHCQLVLENLILAVKLGHSEIERSSTQSVWLKIQLQSAGLVAACLTDDLQGTICYAWLGEQLQAFCDNRSFKLLEALGYQLYQHLKKLLLEVSEREFSIVLAVAKKPPLTTIDRSVFVINDEPSTGLRHRIALEDANFLKLE